MCGIVAVFSSKWIKEERENMVRCMLEDMNHRGPDAKGMFSNDSITLGHARLAIIDLNQRSHQPMFSYDKNHVIIFNGEIYNYKHLRLELERSKAGSSEPAYPFCTSSDTEVVLASYLRWGQDCVKYLKGMFVFVIYDIKQNKIFAARDRFGVKPLYYYFSDDHLVLSSELRPILRHVPASFSTDNDALLLYLNYQTFFHSSTPVRQIKCILPGNYFEFFNGSGTITRYYDVYSQKTDVRFDEEEEIIKQIREKVFISVERRMVSDVPVAAFLSGGVDSSIVVSCMSQISSHPVHTFHITFEEKNFSEKEAAESVAKKYNTLHSNILIRPSEILSYVPLFLDAVDVPSGDGLNTYVISKAVHEKGIRVALSGMGGDEWFMGYPVFPQIYRAYLRRNLYSKIMPLIPSILTDILFSASKSVRNAKICDIIKYHLFSPFQLYSRWRSLFTSRHYPYFRNHVHGLFLKDERKSEKYADDNILSALSCWEWEYYLMPVLLRDADQFSMAHSLEIREPFLDHELAEFCLGIPLGVKKNYFYKKLLIKAFRNDIPQMVWNRPKMGFTFPMNDWLKKELRPLAENELISLQKKNIYPGLNVVSLWERFLKNDPLFGWTRLWHLIVLNHWLEKNKL